MTLAVVLLIAVFVLWLLAALKIEETRRLSWWYAGWAIVALLVLVRGSL